MRTPAGFECKYFYGNYFRGRKQEECRLIGSALPPAHWTPDLCQKCSVPGILRANACEHMELTGRVKRSLFGLIRKVEVFAHCTMTRLPVNEPHVGCGQCHPLPPAFVEKSQ